MKALKKGLKRIFGPLADPGDEDRNDPNTVFVAHDGELPADSEDASADRRREAMQKGIDDLNQSLEKKKEQAKQGPAADGKADAGFTGKGVFDTHELSTWGRMSDRWKLGLIDKGDYMKFKPDPRKTEDQLRAVILRCVFEKGHTDIRFYRRGQIDHQLSAQASLILNKMMQEGTIPGSYNVQVITQRLDRPEPWLGWYGRATRDWRNKRFDDKMDRDRRRAYGSEVRGIGDRIMGAGRGEREVRRRFGAAAWDDIHGQAKAERAPRASEAAAAPGAAQTQAPPETPHDAMNRAANPGTGAAPETAAESPVPPAADGVPETEPRPAASAAPPAPGAAA